MKDKKNTGYLIYITLSIIALILLTYLFWAQSVRLDGKYASDMRTHIERAIENGGTGYSLESKLVVLMDRITGGGTIGFCLLLGVFVILTPLAVGVLFDYIDIIDKKNALGKVRNRYIGLISIFIAPLAIPFIWFYLYDNAMNINAWHNSTSMEMRLFAILAVAFYVYIQYEITEERPIKPFFWLCLSGSLLISAWFKPSFFVGFAPVMFIWIIIDLFKERWSRKAIKNQLILGCAAIPGGVMVFLQYWKLYGSREDVYLTLNSDSNNTIYAIRVGMFLVIPLIICAFNRKRIISDYKSGNRAYVQVWALWAIELLYHQLFTEVGRSGGNFGWGVRIGNYLVFIMSMRLFWSNIRSYGLKREKGESVTLNEKIYLALIGALMLWELGCGIFYFGWVLSGQTYHI